MTELSYIWDGTVTGDATEAPYDKVEFNQYFSGIEVVNAGDMYVIPGYLNDLEVAYTNASSVSVQTGAAIIDQYLYVNTAQVSLQIDESIPSHFRYDYIVLRVDKSNQTVRLAIVKGADVDNVVDLLEPELTQTSLIWEQPIALIYVEYGLALSRQYIYDQRNFAVTNYTKRNYDQKNLVKNSEFMVIDSTGLPALWTFGSGTDTTRSATTKLDTMSRGQAWSLNSTRNFYTLTHFDSMEPGDTFTLKGAFDEITGDSSYFKVSVYQMGLGFSSFYSGNLLTSVTFTRKQAASSHTFQITCKVPRTEPSSSGLAVYIQSAEGTTNIGQFLLVRGYHPGEFRAIEEYIPLETPLTDASWSDTAKSAVTTTINLSSSFGGIVQEQSKAVALRLRARDSGSAAGTPYLRVLGYSLSYNAEYGRVELSGVTNDVYRETTCIVPTNQGIAATQNQNPQFRANPNATGASTLDATIEIIGVFV